MRPTVFLILFTVLSGVLFAGERKTNILLIVSDDQGYADAGFQGSVEIPTPRLDTLAKEGIRCTQGYVTHPFCSPSRAALMTGRYQARFGHEHNPVYDPLDPAEGLPLTERLLPEYMKDAGYRTGWIGKWHLGSSPAHEPWNRGFDETYGFIGGGHAYRNWKPNTRQYTLTLTRNGKPVTVVPQHLTLDFGNEAAQFIKRNRATPWFLYLAFNAPHTPHQPTPGREKRFAEIEPERRRKYVAQVSLLDDAVGMALDALKETGQSERTLVFFFSDNGGSLKHHAINEPLRGGKGTLYEGGVRVPFLVRLPDRQAAGTTCDLPVSSPDVLATMLAANNASMPHDKKYDSVNLLPHLTGDEQARPHDCLFWRLGQTSAVRKGDWKLLRTADDAVELYDLATDVAESRNLATERPEVAAELLTALKEWNGELIAPVFPGTKAKKEDWGPGGINR